MLRTELSESSIIRIFNGLRFASLMFGGVFGIWCLSVFFLGRNGMGSWVKAEIDIDWLQEKENS